MAAVMDKAQPEAPLSVQPPRMPEDSSNAGSLFHRLTRSTTALGVITAALAMFGAVAAAFLSFGERNVAERRIAETSRQREMAERLTHEAERAQAEIAQLREENMALHKTLDGIKQNNKEVRYAELSPADRQQLQQVKNDQDQVRGRLTALEITLMTTPEKAIGVPMLKQQIDTLQDRTHADFDSIRGELGRLFTLTQWFIGLMFTIALGVFGLALSNLRKAPDKAVEKDRPAAA